jgi:hypothetical protein
MRQTEPMTDITGLAGASSCVPWGVDSSCCSNWPDLDEALQTRAIALAWSTLRTLSGGLVGNCPVLMRPCLTSPCNACTNAWMRPVIRNGQWYNEVCGGPRCSCAPLAEIEFPGPVAAILEVLVDGEALAPTAYVMHNSRVLVRTDDLAWPSCQHLNRPVTEVGTVGIEYVPGILPNADGLWAAGVLACEYAKACSGGKCRLPSGVTALARQGVSMVLPSGLFPDNKTGITEVDAFVFGLNPTAQHRPSLVFSPDLAVTQHRFQPSQWTPPVEP